MNKLFMILGAVALISATSFLFMSQVKQNTYGNNEYTIGLWKDFQKTYNREYSNQEEMYRYSVFLENLDYIEQNQGETYTLGITQFADITKAEFAANYLTLVPQNKKNDKIFKASGVTAPSSWNWVQQGNVPAVKNQGNCGSCWAFSAAGTISIAYNIQRGGNDVNLSEQQLVSCDQGSNQGCNGGWMDTAFDYNKQTGLATEAEYPYTSGNGSDPSCNTQVADQASNLKNTGYTDVASNSESLQAAISKAAVAVAVDATNWSFYKSGTFSNCATRLNHGVIAVGYEQNEFWIVRNSWGTGWGQQGYINLAWGNACGILEAPSYVSVPN